MPQSVPSLFFTPFCQRVESLECFERELAERAWFANRATNVAGLNAEGMFSHLPVNPENREFSDVSKGIHTRHSRVANSVSLMNLKKKKKQLGGFNEFSLPRSKPNLSFVSGFFNDRSCSYLEMITRVEFPFWLQRSSFLHYQKARKENDGATETTLAEKTDPNGENESTPFAFDLAPTKKTGARTGQRGRKETEREGKVYFHRAQSFPMP